VALGANYPLPDRLQIRDLKITDLPPIDAPLESVPFDRSDVDNRIYSRDAFLPLTHPAPRPLAFSAKTIHRSVSVTKPFDHQPFHHGWRTNICSVEQTSRSSATMSVPSQAYRNVT
jgi:hypothetical protein